MGTVSVRCHNGVCHTVSLYILIPETGPFRYFVETRPLNFGTATTAGRHHSLSPLDVSATSHRWSQKPVLYIEVRVSMVRLRHGLARKAYLHATPISDTIKRRVALHEYAICTAFGFALWQADFGSGMSLMFGSVLRAYDGRQYSLACVLRVVKKRLR